MKLRDKGSIVSTTHYVFKCLQTCQRKAFNSNVLVWFRSLSRSFICSVCVTLLREALVYFFQSSSKRWWMFQISLKRLKSLMISLKPWWMFQNVPKVTGFTSLTLSRRSRKIQWVCNPEHLWHVELWTENHAKYKKLPLVSLYFLKTWMLDDFLKTS